MRIVYYKKRPSSLRLKKSFTLFFVVFIALIGAFFYLIGRFTVLSIEVSGTQFVSENAIKEIIDSELSRGIFKSNLIILPTNRIKSAISRSFAIESLSVKRKFPHTLLVKIKEFRPAAFWATTGQMFESVDASEGQQKSVDQRGDSATHLFFIDEKGIVLGEWMPPQIETAEEQAPTLPLVDLPKILSEKEFRNLPVIFDAQGILPETGKKVLAESYRISIEKFQKEFSNERFSFSVRYFMFTDALSPREMRVKTNEGFWLILDTGTDWAVVSANLREVIAKKKISDFNKISYIDLRLPDRLFYK